MWTEVTKNDKAIGLVNQADTLAIYVRQGIFPPKGTYI